IYAHECLLRGIDEDGELVYPKRMFDIAYSAQLTYQLDRAARLAAIRTAKEKLLDGNIFINFNPTSVYDPHTCLKSTFAAIQNSHLTPSQIVFEVTESEYVSDVDHLVNIISKYRAEGFRVALDDLGSGYGSLGLLAALKPDLVKFDRKLITNLDTDTFKQRVLTRLFEMTRDLDISTVAEGVEREEERDWLAEHGADYLQGFLFGRPEPDPKYLGGLTPPSHSAVYA
ncbi:MAG: EAL domain-containing protein, partial [Deinococcota bacterium]